MSRGIRKESGIFLRIVLSPYQQRTCVKNRGRIVVSRYCVRVYVTKQKTSIFILSDRVFLGFFSELDWIGLDNEKRTTPKKNFPYNLVFLKIVLDFGRYTLIIEADNNERKNFSKENENDLH